MFLKIVDLALAEDIGNGDLTAALIPEQQLAKARIVSQQAAVICGVDLVNEVYRHLDPAITIKWQVRMGILFLLTKLCVN